MRNLGEPRDPVYHLAVPGYDFFKASYTLVDTLAQTPTVAVEDIVYYSAAYCSYCLAREKYHQSVPSALTLHELETVDSTLRRIIRYATAKPMIFMRGHPVVMEMTMLRHIQYLLWRLLSMRANELRLTINHMWIEGEGLTVPSTTNPHYVDLQSYHRDLDEKGQLFWVNLAKELEAVEKLLTCVDEDKES